ncbi:hypothetical protein H8D29_02435 [PVC group bacterium]|nr:hypothetical protein [PVC group bacterium]
MCTIGCGRKEIRAYQVPREIDWASLEDTQQAETPHDQLQLEEVSWVVPESWELLDKVVSMRYATFLTHPGVEVTLAVFPGTVGGLLANVNRWRGQVGLVPIQESELDECAKQIDGTNSFVVDATGPSVRLVGTVINIGDGRTWFAKAVGQPETIEQIKNDIIAFSASFHIAQPAPRTDDGHSHEPVSGWKQPAEWSVDENASPILMAAYNATSGARITLTALGGSGGGTLDNINRWRDQLGLTPLQSMDEIEVTHLANEAIVVDLVAEDGERRIVSGIVPSGTETLFFKLTGSTSETDSELERFNEFVIGVGLRKQGEH